MIAVELDIILAIVGTVLLAVATFYLARRISERAEIEALRRTVLQKQVNELTVELHEAREAIEAEEAETAFLKSELEEREAIIVEMQERLKFAEKVSERDIDRIRGMLSEILHLLEKLGERIERIERKKEK